MKRGLVLVAAVSVAGCLLARSGRAEGMLDLYLGDSFNKVEGVSFGDELAGGIRGGYWFEGVANFVGIGLDLSYFRPKRFGLEIDLAPLTPMLMLRLPLLVVEERGNPRIAPYAAVGPGLFASSVEEPGDNDVDLDVGLDVRGGITVLPSRHFGLFAEYRRTEVEINNGFFGDLDVKSHHVNAGVAWRF